MARKHTPSTTSTPPSPTNSNITPHALTERDAAIYSSAKRSYLRAARMGRCDGPPYVRMGRAVRYLVSDLDAWLASRRVGGHAENGRGGSSKSVRAASGR